LNQDYLQSIPPLNATNGLAMIFADRQQIDYPDRLTAGLSVERHKLPTCPRCDPLDAHLYHRHGPASGARSFLLRLLPIHHDGLTYTMGLMSIRAHVAARYKTCTPRQATRIALLDRK
jgi:hypothetical protein